MSAKSRRKSPITQFSTVNGLLVGLYDGLFSVDEVLGYGNFGLGCPDAMEGEMIIHDNECFVAPANVAPRKMAGHETVAFAQVSEFEPSITMRIEGPLDKDQLASLLIKYARSENLFIGFRVRGEFTDLTIRQPPVSLAQPYPPMIEVLKTQTKVTHPESSGTLIGYWTPKQYQGTSVAGIHIHFIQDDNLIGGHVMNLNINSGVLEAQIYHNFNLILPGDESFLAQDLNYQDLDAHIKEAEG